MKLYILVITSIVIALTSCGGGSSSGNAGSFSNDDGPQLSPAMNKDCEFLGDEKSVQFGRTVPTQTISSVITGIDYPVDVYLPASYDDNSDLYPVIYATDGQWIFDSFAGLVDEMGLDIILIAIHQGPENRRMTDYTLDGIETYLDFFMTDYIPQMELQYRINSSERTLQGASIGGLFALMTMLFQDENDPDFKRYIAMDPSMSYQGNSTYTELESERFERSSNMRVELMMTGAKGWGGNHVLTEMFYDRLRNRKYENFDHYHIKFGVCHNGVANPSFEHALQRYF